MSLRFFSQRLLCNWWQKKTKKKKTGKKKKIENSILGMKDTGCGMRVADSAHFVSHLI